MTLVVLVSGMGLPALKLLRGGMICHACRRSCRFLAQESTLVSMRGSFSTDNHLWGGYIRRMPCIWDFDGLNLWPFFLHKLANPPLPKLIDASIVPSLTLPTSSCWSIYDAELPSQHRPAILANNSQHPAMFPSFLAVTEDACFFTSLGHWRSFKVEDPA